MNKYLTKLAKEYYTRIEESDPRVSSAIGTAVVGGVAAHQLNKRVGNLIQQHAVAPMLHSEPTVPKDVLDRLRRVTLRATNTTMDIDRAGGHKSMSGIIDVVANANGPAFYPKQSLGSMQKTLHRVRQLGGLVAEPVEKLSGGMVDLHYDNSLAGKPTFNKNYLHLGNVKNTDILAHELGHAVDYTKGNTGLKRGVSNVSRILHGTPSAALGGLMLTNENTRDYAWAVPLAVAAPTLRDEAAANLNAAKLVRKYGGNAAKLRGMFGRNLLSYSVPALAASGALAGVNYLRRKGEEVNPGDWIKERE